MTSEGTEPWSTGAERWTDTDEWREWCIAELDCSMAPDPADGPLTDSPRKKESGIHPPMPDEP